MLCKNSNKKASYMKICTYRVLKVETVADQHRSKVGKIYDNSAHPVPASSKKCYKNSCSRPLKNSLFTAGQDFTLVKCGTNRKNFGHLHFNFLVQLKNDYKPMLNASGFFA